jgi:hypothetical protein
MDDIISLGQGGGPGPRTRRIAALAVTILIIVLAFAAIRHLSERGSAAARHPVAVVASGPIQLAGLGDRAARMLNLARESHQMTRASAPAGSARLPAKLLRWRRHGSIMTATMRCP